MTSTVLRAFVTRSKEGAIIGRLLAGYGNLEYDLCQLAAAITGNFDVSFKVMFRTRGETQRISIADGLTRSHLAVGKFRSLYEDTIGHMRHCLKIRNQFAHCNWYINGSGELCFVNLEEIAKEHKKVNTDDLTSHKIDFTLLEIQEDFFYHVDHNLIWMRLDLEHRAGRGPTPFPLDTKKYPLPILYNP